MTSGLKETRFNGGINTPMKSLYELLASPARCICRMMTSTLD